MLHFVYFEAEHAYAQLIANRYSEVLWQAWWQYFFYFSFTKVTIVMYNIIELTDYKSVLAISLTEVGY